MEWSTDTIARLRSLWAEGHSTAEIGRRIAMSKNAVVGKAHRLGLAARPSPIRRDGGACPRPLPSRSCSVATLPSLSAPEAAPLLGAIAAGPQASASVPVPPPAAAAEASAVVVAKPAAASAAAAVRAVPPPRSARHIACCWPLGDPGTKSFRFCDDDALAGKPYCAAHARLAYVKVRDRREDAAA